MKRARSFYEEKLGLETETREDMPEGLFVHAGKGTLIFLYERGRATAENTALTSRSTTSRRRSRLRSTASARGVRLPGLKTVNGIATATSTGAWFKDSEGNILCRVTLALSHLKPQGTRLREIFSGAVAPAHAGATVRIQKAAGTGWRTVASGKLDGSSRYRVIWSVPFRTASYKLRATLPTHADHAEGDSQTASFKVVIRKG